MRPQNGCLSASKNQNLCVDLYIIYTKLHVFNPKEEQSFSVQRSFFCLCYPCFLTLVVLFLFTLPILLILDSLKMVISETALNPISFLYGNDSLSSILQKS